MKPLVLACFFLLACLHNPNAPSPNASGSPTCDVHAHPFGNGCECDSGYSGDGTSCSQSNCDINASVFGGKCTCNPGYTGDGTSCSHPTCDINASWTGAMCTCNPGYSGDGTICNKV
jgi:hypothetical protein